MRATMRLTTGTIRNMLLPLALLLPLASCAAIEPATAESQSAEAPAAQWAVSGETLILDRAAADRLLAADGITLQWIGWDRRGPVSVREERGTIRLTGSQEEAEGPGRLFVDGMVREIGEDYFILDGTVRITGTPDRGRTCEADKLWHFAITQNRQYWRLREFEWCDGLTDYVDIYF